MEIPKGLCQCGCGQITNIATRNRREREQTKGQPMPFLHGHRPVLGHGQCRRGATTSEYSTYIAAKQRCVNPKDSSYEDYGKRGIKFLFTSFEQFFAELGPRPKGKSLDRLNNDGNYEPGNVRWATSEEQVLNQRPIRNDNTSGHKGVYWNKGSKAWTAGIGVKGKYVYLGFFTNFEDACLVRNNAELKYWKGKSVSTNTRKHEK